MTLEVVFHALKTGELTLESEFYISEHAWRDGGANSGGSTMFAKLGSMVPLDALLHGIIVQSGNGRNASRLQKAWPETKKPLRS